MLLMRLLVLPSMLATESWMVVHVAVSTVQSRILRILANNLEDMLDPLHIDDRLLWRELVFLCWIWTSCRINWNGLTSLGRTSSTGPLRSVLAFFPCPRILGGLHGLGAPAIELFNSLSPPWMVVESSRLNHADVLVRHVHKAFAILLWTYDILLVPLVGWSHQRVAILPWSRNLWKAFGLRQCVIELLHHVIYILELCILMEIAFPVASRGNAWSQADHCTTHDSAHGVCKCTIWMTGILLAQLDAHQECAFLA